MGRWALSRPWQALLGCRNSDRNPERSPSGSRLAQSHCREAVPGGFQMDKGPSHGQGLGAQTPPDAPDPGHPGHPRTPGYSCSRSIGRLINDSALRPRTPNANPKLRDPICFMVLALTGYGLWPSKPKIGKSMTGPFGPERTAHAKPTLRSPVCFMVLA